MDLKSIVSLLKKKAGAEESYPFGPEAMVFKVKGKMYSIVAWTEEPLRITLKCDPDEADFLRNAYDAIQPGYYMNKEHWNTITLDGSVSYGQIQGMIDDSYLLVVKGLKKADRIFLGVE